MKSLIVTFDQIEVVGINLTRNTHKHASKEYKITDLYFVSKDII